MQEREEEEEINGNVRKSKFIQIRANQKASKRLFTRIESIRFKSPNSCEIESIDSMKERYDMMDGGMEGGSRRSNKVDAGIKRMGIVFDGIVCLPVWSSLSLSSASTHHHHQQQQQQHHHRLFFFFFFSFHSFFFFFFFFCFFFCFFIFFFIFFFFFMPETRSHNNKQTKLLTVDYFRSFFFCVSLVPSFRAVSKLQ